MSETLGSPVALLGGTFDPVHYGHLRPAIELVEGLGLAELRLVPGRVPPHRPQPRQTPAVRCQLLQQAVASIPGLVVDERELTRAGPSYTVDTLAGLRAELGAQRPLYFIMGSDAFRGLPHWHHWQALTDYAHLVVTTRGGDEGEWPPVLMQWLKSHHADDLRALRMQPAGLVGFYPVSQLTISATHIRRLLAQGRSAQGLLPESVWRHVASAGLYGYPQALRAGSAQEVN